MTALTPAQLRADFPEFSSTTVYPDGMLTFWISIATQLVANAVRWGTLITFGQELFVAHNLVIEAQGLADVSVGNQPGSSLTGPISARSTDKVSINYDTQAAMEKDAGHWNLSVYGKRFWRLAEMVGMGGVQVGANGVGDACWPWA